MTDHAEPLHEMHAPEDTPATTTAGPSMGRRGGGLAAPTVRIGPLMLVGGWREALPRSLGMAVLAWCGAGCGLEGGMSASFSFAVVDDPVETALQQGNVLAADGSMDEPTEEFTLTIDPTTTPGSYRLEFYNAPSGQPNPTTIAVFTLVVTS